MKKLLFLSLVITGIQGYAQTPSFSPHHKLVLCGYNDVYFVCDTPQNPTHVKWDFGDGATGTGVSVVHRYNAYGIFKVKMWVEKSLVADSVEIDSFVTVRPNPQASFTITPPELLKPRTRVFTSTSQHFADSFRRMEWTLGSYRDSVRSAFEYTFPAEGEYQATLKVINNFDCMHTVSKTVKVENDGSVNEVGIDETTAGLSASVYPNPAAGTVYVTTKTGAEITEVVITDISGKTVMHRKGTVLRNGSLDLSALESGTYFMMIRAGDLYAHKKILRN